MIGEKYLLTLDQEIDNNNDSTDFSTGTIGIQEKRRKLCFSSQELNVNNLIIITLLLDKMNNHWC